MNASSSAPNSRSPAAFARGRVIAVGRAGAEMAELLRTHNGDGFSFALIDGDAAAVEASPMPEKLFVGGRLTRGFGAGGDPDIARAAADDEAAAIRALCAGHPLILITAGLGGGSGTGITPVVARIARETGASVFSFVTLPFACEGSRRQQQAVIGLHRLKTVADGVLCLPNEKLLLLADDRTTLLEAFHASREHIRDAVRCIWGLLTRPGLMNVSFADICSVLRGPNLESAFARIDVSGPDRADHALKRLVDHPLLAAGETLRRAESLLVSFTAGPDLGMGEIRRIMDELNRHADGARVVVGASVEPAAGEQLTLSVVASTRHLVLHEAAEDAGTDRPPQAARENGDDGSARAGRRLAPPPPELTPELADQLLARDRGRVRRSRKSPQQVPLPFELVTKGRFEKCEPTVRRGNNLDQPTYLRRGVPLN
jgi:cell division protein FtsZ